MTAGYNYGRDENMPFFQKQAAVVITILLFLYILFPVLAPILVHNGLNQPARLIYRFYSPLCHQLAYRSFFLFGEQPYYPLAENNPPGMISYEQAFGQIGADFDAARGIIGNETHGYKIALCQRDLAIYGSLFLFGLFFLAAGKKIKRIPLVLWIALGVLPLSLDGITQLLYYVPGVNFTNAVLRESTPWLRSVTGAMFGFFTGWYIFPAVEDLVNSPKRSDGNSGQKV